MKYLNTENSSRYFIEYMKLFDLLSKTQFAVKLFIPKKSCIFAKIQYSYRDF